MSRHSGAETKKKLVYEYSRGDALQNYTVEEWIWIHDQLHDYVLSKTTQGVNI